MAFMMDDEHAKEMFDMVRDNNRMLRSMRRNAFVGGIFKIVIWVVFLVVIPYLTWLYFQPYLELITSQYQQVQGQSAEVSALMEQIKNTGSGLPSLEDIKSFFGGVTPK